VGSDPRPTRGRGTDLTEIAQVVPDVPTFAVDDGFAYEVPDALTGVTVGSIVRIPLGGRRVRGFVTAMRRGAPGRPLKPIAGISGDLPVFDTDLLQTARWAASHYVTPLAAVLRMCAPRNNPAAGRTLPAVDRPLGPAPPVPIDGLERSAKRAGTHVVVTGHRTDEIVHWAAATAGEDANMLVVCPTVAEAEATAQRLAPAVGSVLIAHSGRSATEETAAWVALATTTGRVAVTTRESTFWPVTSLGLAVVVDDGRRGHTSRQMPTYQTRAVLRRRAAVERFPLLVVGAVPTTDALASGADVLEPSGRVWPLVEIADRAEEPPGRGTVMERTRTALRAIVRGGGTAFVLTRRRGYAPVFRCIACGTIRRCPRCGAGGGEQDSCVRCGTDLGRCDCGNARFEALGAGVGRVVDELRRSLGDAVTRVGGAGAVTVGTVRDLVHIERVDLAVCVDADSFVLAPHYRSGEDALRTLARLALLVEPGRGKRALIQTAMPEHPVYAALRRGRPLGYLREELVERARAGMPPVADLLAFEVDRGADVDAALRRIVGDDGDVLGPAEGDGTWRWLVQGDDLRAVKTRLRALVQRLRDAAVKVRVNVDPIDL